MPDVPVKQRISRAKKAAIGNLLKTGYRIIPSNNSTFCILGVRKREVRMIRVVVDKITERDIQITREFDSPADCSKEIWCRKAHKKDFEILEI